MVELGRPACRIGMPPARPRPQYPGVSRRFDPVGASLIYGDVLKRDQELQKQAETLAKKLQNDRHQQMNDRLGDLLPGYSNVATTYRSLGFTQHPATGNPVPPSEATLKEMELEARRLARQKRRRRRAAEKEEAGDAPDRTAGTQADEIAGSALSATAPSGLAWPRPERDRGDAADGAEGSRIGLASETGTSSLLTQPLRPSEVSLAPQGNNVEAIIGALKRRSASAPVLRNPLAPSPSDVGRSLAYRESREMKRLVLQNVSNRKALVLF